MNFAIWFLQNFVDAIEFLWVPIFKKIQFVYTQQSAQVDIQKEKISFGTRFCGTQSLVCYTFVPTAVKRMSVALHDSRLFIGAEQADKLRKEQKKFIFLTARKRNKRYMKIPAAAERKFYFFFAASKKNGMSALCKSSFIS